MNVLLLSSPSATYCLAPGTGSVLKIQELLHICSESYKSEDEGEEGGREGEGGGRKAGELDSKAAGKGKDKSESKYHVSR